MSVTIITSLAALLIALYGIVERRMAAYATKRVRLGELLETIQGFSVEEARARAQDPDGTLNWLLGRRAVVTYQALGLVDELSRAPAWLGANGRLTAAEYNALADSLMWLGEYGLALDEWQRALDAEVGNLPLVRSTAMSGKAAALGDLNRLDEMRDTYRKTVELHPADPLGWVRRVDVYSWWMQAEGQHGTDKVDEVRALAHKALDAIEDPVLQRETEKRLDRAEHELGLEPLGSASARAL